MTHRQRGFVYSPVFTREALIHAAVQGVLDELGASFEERQRVAAGLMRLQA